MTESHEDENELRCLWCRRQLPPQPAVGRKRTYCRQSCRQRSYEARRQADLLGLSEHELVITKAELERLQDLAYSLQGVVIETDRMLAHDATAADIRSALADLLRAARPLVEGPLI